jgi:hypothetical protein
VITPLFSLTHREHFFCPFVFSKQAGATFIFNIFLCGVISPSRFSVGGEVFVGAALRWTFIALLAYTPRLGSSRDNLQLLGSSAQAFGLGRTRYFSYGSVELLLGIAIAGPDQHD